MGLRNTHRLHFHPLACGHLHLFPRPQHHRNTGPAVCQPKALVHDDAAFRHGDAGRAGQVFPCVLAGLQLQAKQGGVEGLRVPSKTPCG